MGGGIDLPTCHTSTENHGRGGGQWGARQVVAGRKEPLGPWRRRNWTVELEDWWTGGASLPFPSLPCPLGGPKHYSSRSSHGPLVSISSNLLTPLWMCFGGPGGLSAATLYLLSTHYWPGPAGDCDCPLNRSQCCQGLWTSPLQPLFLECFEYWLGGFRPPPDCCICGCNKYSYLVFIDKRNVLFFHTLVVHSESKIEIYGDIDDVVC